MGIMKVQRGRIWCGVGADVTEVGLLKLLRRRELRWVEKGCGASCATDVGG